jgi:hypothetical protein
MVGVLTFSNFGGICQHPNCYQESIHSTFLSALDSDESPIPSDQPSISSIKFIMSKAHCDQGTTMKPNWPPSLVDYDLPRRLHVVFDVFPAIVQSASSTWVTFHIDQIEFQI